jgi:hypothetical protein
MAKITIDLSKWATARQLATEQGWDKVKDCTQRVTNIVKRQQVKVWAIPELGIRLIDRNQFNKAITE